MCGRFTHLYTWRQLLHLMSLGNVQVAEPDAALFSTSFNVAPTQRVPVVRQDDNAVGYISPLRWGLVPSWADDVAIGNRLINARSEEAASKPSFRVAAKHRRCLVPVSGFYEWQAIEGGKTKQPWYFTPAQDDLFMFAGLWERWDKGSEPVESFTILTRAPNELVATLHDRMPCIVSPEHFGLWLNPSIKEWPALSPALAAFPANRMAKRAVSTRVNSPRNNDPSLLEQAA